MNTSLEQLEAFVTVAECGSISLAAKKLQRSKSTISTHVQNLEIELATQLLNRDSRHCELTQFGRELLQYAQTVLANLESMQHAAYEINTTGTLQLRLGVDTSLWHDTIAHEIAKLLQQYPQLDLKLSSGNSSQLLDKLAAQQVDIALIISMLQYPESVYTARSFSFEAKFYVAADHDLAGRSITFHELVNSRQLLYQPFLDAELNRTQQVALQTLEMDDLNQILSLVEQGVGWATLPDYLAQPAVKAGSLVELQVTDSPTRASWSSELMWHKELALTPAMRELIQCLSALNNVG